MRQSACARQRLDDVGQREHVPEHPFSLGTRPNSLEDATASGAAAALPW